MRTSKRRRDRYGSLVFFLPLIIILVVVVYGYVQLNTPGTLKVTAIVQDNYVNTGYKTVSLQVPIQIQSTGGGSSPNSGTTPVSFSLSSGNYVVTYGTVQWYSTPAEKTVGVPNGQTVYAVGVYNVTATIVAVNQTSFNSTSVAALHSVTPVIWINTSNSVVVLDVQSVGTLPLEAGQNYTEIFQSTGTYSYSLSSGATGSLHVS